MSSSGSFTNVNIVNEFATEALFSKVGTVNVAIGKNRWYTTGGPRNIAGVLISVGTAPVGSSLIVDVLKNTFDGGDTIFTTVANRPTVVANTFEVKSVAPDVTAIDDGDYLTVNITQVGSSVPGSDLTVQILFD